jgi:hypothetical protein
VGRFALVPLTLGEAQAFVLAHHRHHGEVAGHKFSLGLSEHGRICGVAIVGRPSSRMLDTGTTLEVTRLATDGTKDACSALYGACRRATFALGYRKLITYILGTESGISLTASGFRCLGEAGGGSWTSTGRPRVDRGTGQRKLRWEVEAAS